MANPQVENGHIRIANDLYDAMLLFPFSKRQLLVALAILRLTYGWSKKIDRISYGQIAKVTRLDRRNVIRAMAELEKMKVVSKQPLVQANVIGINKDFDSWKVVVKTTTGVKTTTRASGQIDHPPQTVQPRLFNAPDFGDESERNNPPHSCSPPRNGVEPPGFESFWKAYPRKVGKGAARRAWKKIKAPLTKLPEILHSIETQKTSSEWSRENGRYIPHPATWLNQERWSDEIIQPGPMAHGHSEVML